MYYKSNYDWSNVVPWDNMPTIKTRDNGHYWFFGITFNHQRIYL